MSAYVVEPETIARIIAFLEWDTMPKYPGIGNRQALADAGLEVETGAGREKLGRLMWEMNVRAVCKRYQDDTPAHYPYNGLPAVHAPTAIQAYKALECYLYQCAEANMPDCKLYRLLEGAANRLGAAILRTLPEYEAAEWG